MQALEVVNTGGAIHPTLDPCKGWDTERCEHHHQRHGHHQFKQGKTQDNP
jgi:hypothetical protein